MKETEPRIFLSPLEPDRDGEIIDKWMNDLDNGRFLMKSYLEAGRKKSADKWKKRISEGDRAFMVKELGTEKPIGFVWLFYIKHEAHSAALGICIGEPDYQSKGYGSEALRLTLDYAFGFMNMNSVELWVLSCNKRAIRAYEKVGFKTIGRHREARRIGGQWYDLIYMDILSREYEVSPSYLEQFRVE